MAKSLIFNFINARRCCTFLVKYLLNKKRKEFQGSVGFQDTCRCESRMFVGCGKGGDEK